MLVFFIIITALVLYMQFRSRRRGGGLEATISLTKNLAEPGEELELVVTISNRTRALLPFLKLSVSMPKGVSTTQIEKRRRMRLTDQDEIVMSTWAAPMQELRLRIPVMAERRGRYVFEGLSISEGDFLGLGERLSAFNVFAELVIVPKAAPRRALRQIPGSFPGDISVKRFLFEDPVLTVGFRDYTGREPMRSISWNASARAGKLMVREYDHTMDVSVMVVVNVHTSAREMLRLVAECYALTRTVCRALEDRGIKYSLFTDASADGPSEPMRYVGEGLGGRHFLRVLELLGRSTLYGRDMFERVLEQAAAMTHGLCGILLITPALDRDIMAAAGRCASRRGVGLTTLTPEGAAV